MDGATTIPVREGEAFPVLAVQRLIREAGLCDTAVPLSVEQFAAGHSNLTYRLRMGSWVAVLRRPPLGRIAPKAHDMQREFQILSAVYPRFAQAPKPLLFCDDLGVIGSPFYIMEERTGVMLEREWPDAYEHSPAVHKRIAYGMMETLLAVHRVDCADEALASLGHPDGYMERQVQNWIARHASARTEADETLSSEIGAWLLHHVPQSTRPSLIHNDFKLNNVLFSRSQVGEVTGVVDWEMATIGEPLSDLAITLSYWVESTDPAPLRQLSPLTAQPGFPSRQELAAWYAEQTGVGLDWLDAHMVFAYFKNAGICQQIYYRYVQGQTHDARFQSLGYMAQCLLGMAKQYIDYHSGGVSRG